MIIKSSSSGINGWSNLSDFLNCSMRAAQKRLHYQEGMVFPLPEEEQDEKGRNKPHALVVGSVYGDMCQHHLTGRTIDPHEPVFWQYENGDTQDLEKTHPATIAEARRLYIAYTKKYPSSDHLGKVIAVEFPIRIPGELTGLPFDITGSIDAVVETDKGIKIDDLKTEAAERDNLIAKFSLREQLWIYDWGYELATGIMPVENEIDLCVKTKEPKFFKYPYPALTEKRLHWLKFQIQRMWRNMQNPEPNPKPDNCWSMMSKTPCQYLGADNMCSLL